MNLIWNSPHPKSSTYYYSMHPLAYISLLISNLSSFRQWKCEKGTRNLIRYINFAPPLKYWCVTDGWVCLVSLHTYSLFTLLIITYGRIIQVFPTTISSIGKMSLVVTATVWSKPSTNAEQHQDVHRCEKQCTASGTSEDSTHPWACSWKLSNKFQSVFTNGENSPKSRISINFLCIGSRLSNAVD